MAETVKPPSATPAKGAKTSRKPDIASIAGILIAFGGILGGLVIEGGKLKDIAQFTAALIVLGGTSGAVMVSLPLKTVIGGLKRLDAVLFESHVNLGGVIEEVIGFATK